MLIGLNGYTQAQGIVLLTDRTQND